MNANTSNANNPLGAGATVVVGADVVVGSTVDVVVASAVVVGATVVVGAALVDSSVASTAAGSAGAEVDRSCGTAQPATPTSTARAIPNLTAVLEPVAATFSSSPDLPRR